MSRKFLGRTLDPRTMTYSFSDGSGGPPLPEEMRQDVLCAAEKTFGSGYGNAPFVLGAIERWKKRLSAKEPA